MPSRALLSAFVVLCTCMLPVTQGSPTASPSPSPSPTPAPTPYAISTIGPQADAALAQLSQYTSDIQGDDFADGMHKLVPKLSDDLQRKEQETNKVLAGVPKIGVLQEQATSWSVLHDDVLVRLKLLNDKLAKLDIVSTQLKDMTQTWTLTSSTLNTPETPADLKQKSSDVLTRINATGKALDAKRADLLRLQSQLIAQNTQITTMLGQVEKARGDALGRLSHRDSPPLWHAFSGTVAQAVPSEKTLSSQATTIWSHLVAERGMVLMHLTLWVVLIFIFRWARATVKSITATDTELNRSTAIFDVPLATATLIALLFASPLYAGISPVLTALLGAALLAPLLRIVSRVMPPSLRPITWALALFYLTAQVREATSVFPFLTRLIYFAEMIGGVVFSLWLIKESRTERSLLWLTLRVAARVGVVLFLISGVANFLGYVNLAQFASSVTLDSAYVAILLYAASHILTGLAVFALNVRPLTKFGVVARHGDLLEKRIAWLIRVGCVLLWVAFFLEKTLLLQPAIEGCRVLLEEPRVAGVSLGGVATFILTVWASFLVSRFVRFVLEEDVYQRVQLKPGLPFAISTMLHYVILLLGFYIATAALLGDMSKFTILAGAFGVGIGFGLQNIVNNFVSSIIVLFERPIKIGDLVAVGTQQGTVRAIGIRATIIRSSDGSDVIIPNGKLISDPVTNWTLLSHQRQIQIAITTPAKGVDANQVITLMEQAANESPAVLKSPAPSAILATFGANQLTFEVRVWTDEHQNLRRVKSNLAVAISRLLVEHEVPTA